MRLTSDGQASVEIISTDLNALLDEGTPEARGSILDALDKQHGEGTNEADASVQADPATAQDPSAAAVAEPVSPKVSCQPPKTRQHQSHHRPNPAIIYYPSHSAT